MTDREEDERDGAAFSPEVTPNQLFNATQRNKNQGSMEADGEITLRAGTCTDGMQL